VIKKFLQDYLRFLLVGCFMVNAGVFAEGNTNEKPAVAIFRGLFLVHGAAVRCFAWRY
jgi:hypothetical protein